ncbi:MAG: hypothetical protein CFH00_00759, partial [Alphaproteobacteria bacterium MarineAlpha1_Bin1]
GHAKEKLQQLVEITNRPAPTVA